MAKFYCNNCGAVFDEDEADYYDDFVGYYGEQECYQTYMQCPECGDEDCEEYHEEEEESEDE